MISPLSYAQRATYTSNATAKRLFQLMEQKQTNLCLSLDITHSANFLALADLIGPEICLLKTHIDTLEDFHPSFIFQLTTLAQKHQFLIFEDRKFADIGHTVQLQYAGGIYKIADWADITNAHILPGAGIIEGLQSIGLVKDRGLLLLAQMSAKDNLLDQHYTQRCIEMADCYPEFVMGFIATQKISDHPGWIHMTPGIHQASAGDNLGQQYLTPEKAILEQKTDIIIVGRGIYEAANPFLAAKNYRKAGWEAYRSR